MFGGFPDDTVVKEATCQCRRCRSRGFDPKAGKSPWSRKWQPAPVLLPGKSHGQRSLAGYSPLGHKELDMTEHEHISVYCFKESELYSKSNGENEVISKRISSVQFSSVAQSCPTLCDPMNRSTPGLPVHHQLPEFTQTHVHRVGDATPQKSHTGCVCKKLKAGGTEASEGTIALI